MLVVNRNEHAHVARRADAQRVQMVAAEHRDAGAGAPQTVAAAIIKPTYSKMAKYASTKLAEYSSSWRASSWATTTVGDMDATLDWGRTRWTWCWMISPSPTAGAERLMACRWRTPAPRRALRENTAARFATRRAWPNTPRTGRLSVSLQSPQRTV